MHVTSKEVKEWVQANLHDEQIMDWLNITSYPYTSMFKARQAQKLQTMTRVIKY